MTDSPPNFLLRKTHFFLTWDHTACKDSLATGNQRERAWAPGEDLAFLSVQGSLHSPSNHRVPASHLGQRETTTAREIWPPGVCFICQFPFRGRQDVNYTLGGHKWIRCVLSFVREGGGNLCFGSGGGSSNWWGLELWATRGARSVDQTEAKHLARCVHCQFHSSGVCIVYIKFRGLGESLVKNRGNPHTNIITNLSLSLCLSHIPTPHTHTHTAHDETFF